MLDCHGGDSVVQSSHKEEEIEGMKGNDGMDQLIIIKQNMMT